MMPRRRHSGGASPMDRVRLGIASTVVAMLLLCTACSEPAPSNAEQAAAQELAAWQARAQNVTIVRDDWGIPHVHGKTDADAVFGLMYAQAEDDFNRIETNYLLSQGRLAEAEGEKEI